MGKLAFWLSIGMLPGTLAETGNQISASVALPCLKASKSGFMRSCDEFLPKILGSLQKNLDNKLKCIDEGKDVDIFSDPKVGSASAVNPTNQIQCSDYEFKPFEKFCNLSRGEEKTPLPTRNATYSDCGKPSVLVSGKMYAHGTVGTQEARYIQGAFVQALVSCHARLSDEIKSQKMFTTSTCAPLAIKDYQKGLSSFAALVKSAKVGSLDETEYASVDKYCSENTNPAAQSEDPEKLKHQMAVCYLSAARTHLEAMVSYLANCELFGRWSQWWFLNMPKFRIVIQELGTHCDIYAASKAKETKWGCCGYKLCPDWACKTTKDTEDYEKIFNQCYRDNLPVFMKKKMDELIPNSKEGCKF